MRDQLDQRVHDFVALDEIDLYADVLSAVAAADRPLTSDELDVVLGVSQAPEAGPGRCLQPGPRSEDANITSVSQCVNPSDSYSPIAAVLPSST